MTAQASAQLPTDFCKVLVARLSTSDSLRLPAYLTRATPQPDQQAITTYLSELLQRDPAVFLERYSKLLTQDEIQKFDPLRSDYEVDYWLKQAETQHDSITAGGPKSSSSKALSNTAKNRRLAQMYRLEQQGDYFSETSMRERQPLIWHHHIGQYEGHPPPPAGGQQQSGLGFADSLLRAQDEVQLRARLQQQLEEEECQMSEHDSDSEDQEQQNDMDVQQKQQQADAQEPPQKQQDQAATDLSLMRQRRQDFLDEMQSRFLSGLDIDSVDYAAIDGDVQLDEVWAAQQAQDAEDAYFEAD